MTTTYETFGPERAECSRCELKAQCDLGKHAPAAAPTKPFNGLMIIGEGPGRNEVLQKAPFVGPAGQLLNWLLEVAGIEREACYVTNATLCCPPYGEGDFAKRFPTAVHACLSRLEAEIAAVRPRVIVTLGARALEAVTGYEVEHTKLGEAPPCEHCASKRTVRGIQCTKCNHVAEVPEGQTPPAACPSCAANWARMKVRDVKCPVCGGKKRVQRTEVTFEHDYKISEVAGAIIPGTKSGWDAFGVQHIVPTYHPSFLLRPPPAGARGGQFYAEPVIKHLKKAHELLTSPKPVLWTFEHAVTHPSDHAAAAAQLRAFAKGVSRVTVDIETEAWGTGYRCSVCQTASSVTFRDKRIDPMELECEKCKQRSVHVPVDRELDATDVYEVSKIKCIGFAHHDKALVVDTRSLDGTDETNPLWQALCATLEDAGLGKIFHNGNYDVPVIYKLWGIDVKGYEHDTLILHHDLYPDEAHGLAHVAFSYENAPIWKPPKKLHGREAHESWEELAEYNARDVCLTDDACTRMLHELSGAKVEDVYRIDMQLEQLAIEMWKNGMNVDRDAALKVGAEALSREQAATAAMRELLKWPDFNPRSSGQLAEALFDRLGYTPTKMTDGGARATNKDVIVALDDSPFKRMLIEQRDAAANLRNYFDVIDGVAYPGRSLALWGDNRIRAVWKAFGTRTGRFSSNPNFQNWPKWMRSLVTAPAGRKIVGADYDQLELRILAGLSGDEVLIDKCVNADEDDKLNPDCDPHSYVAALAFGSVFTNLDKNDPKHDKKDVRCRCQKCERKALRDLCKRVIYGLNYGAGDAKVLESIYAGGYDGPPLTVGMITRIRTSIYAAFRGVQPYQQRLLRKAEQEQEIRSPLLGRRRIFPLGEVPFTEILNFPIQSGGADIVNQRLILLHREVRRIDPGALLLAQVHDAVYYECDDAAAEEIRDCMTETLSWTTPMYPGGPALPFTAAGSIADNWKDAA